MAKSKSQSLWLHSSLTPLMISLSPRFDSYPHFHEAYEQYTDFPRGARHAQVPVRWVLTSKLFEPIVLEDEDEREQSIEHIRHIKADMRAGRDIPPVLIEKGRVFDGRHRIGAAWEDRIKYVPVVDVADLKKSGRKNNPTEGESLRVTNSQGLTFLVTVVRQGERYGHNKQLTHDQADPLIEVYDLTQANTPKRGGFGGFGPEGQFVSRYDASTLAGGTGGIDLQGGVPEWRIDAAAFAPVRALARKVADPNTKHWTGKTWQELARQKNPTEGEAAVPVSSETSAFKLAAKVAIVGLIVGGIYKFFTKDTGTLVVDTSKAPPPKPTEPEKPLVGSKILAKLPAFDPSAPGTVPYYVVNVFAEQELPRPEPGAVDIATYLRSVPAEDIDVHGPFLPAQKPNRFEGPLPTLAVIVAPSGMVITSMDKADLQALAPSQ